MLVVGLTGGIGSGKSTLADLLEDRGAVVIDADEIAREIVEPGEPALEAIVEAFGPEVATEEGLDREAMAARVFADDDARRRLEEITHPRIAEEIGRRLAEVAAGENDGPEQIVVVDHPLLVETGHVENFPVVVVVAAPREVRLRRLAEERGMAPEDVRARMRAQATEEQRRAVATHVVDNSGDLADLRRAAEELWRSLRRRAAGDGA